MTEKHYSPAYLAYMDMHKPTESGRYAEAGYNDHFNDGLDALWDALEEAGIVGELALPLDPLPWRHDCWDDGTCDAIGERHENKGVNDEFDPREGYEQDRSKYA